MPVALQFEHVSKRYDSHYYRTLRDSVSSLGTRLVGRYVPPVVERALDDIDFTIAEGESVAIIGRNGAGKTTALKLATRILFPTEGVVRVRGRVGALIEVGTGMHPELTGRENIGLFGRILGFKPKEIASRFDEIVAFAGIEQALDHPVKYYSSGMQLRLGFSLASHLEPDVLMVDEAIAVGDAGFQYRCVERMREVVRSGRTLIFVSHDLGAVAALCDRVILLDQGRVVTDGAPREVIRMYLDATTAARVAETPFEDHDGPLTISRITVHDSAGRQVERLASGDSLTVKLRYSATEPIPGPIFTVGLGAGSLGCFSIASMQVGGQSPKTLMGNGIVECTFESLPLDPGTYDVWVSVRGEIGFGELVDWRRRTIFQIADDEWDLPATSLAKTVDDAPIRIPHRWSVDDGLRDAPSARTDGSKK